MVLLLSLCSGGTIGGLLQQWDNRSFTKYGFTAGFVLH